jgi:hypothetical protein
MLLRKWLVVNLDPAGRYELIDNRFIRSNASARRLPSPPGRQDRRSSDLEVIRADQQDEPRVDIPGRR